MCTCGTGELQFVTVSRSLQSHRSCLDLKASKHVIDVCSMNLSSQ